MGTVSAGGSIGERYVPDAKALQRLEAYPETIHVDDLGDFGFHREIIEGLRVHQMVVSNAQVRAWIERGIPSRPEGHRGPMGPCSASCKGIGYCSCPLGTGPEGPPGIPADKPALPWYVEHLMRQQRRQNRMI